MTLYGAAKAPADPLREAGTTVAALTDNSGGSATETLAVVTNHTALTDSTSGATVTTLLEVVSGGSGATAGAFNDAAARDAAIVIINDNSKALVVGNIAQRLWNIAVLNAVASLADKVSDLITHLDDGR